jgi:hypothetical protein
MLSLTGVRKFMSPRVYSPLSGDDYVLDTCGEMMITGSPKGIPPGRKGSPSS